MNSLVSLVLLSACRDPEPPPLTLSQWRLIEARSQSDPLIKQILSMEAADYREHRDTLIEIATSRHHPIILWTPWTPEQAVAWMQDHILRKMVINLDTEAVKQVAYSQPGLPPEACDEDLPASDWPLHCVAWHRYSSLCQLYDPEQDLVILPDDPSCAFHHPNFVPFKPQRPEIYQKVPGGWENQIAP